jgi:hypothetical protein
VRAVGGANRHAGGLDTGTCTCCTALCMLVNCTRCTSGPIHHWLGSICVVVRGCKRNLALNQPCTLVHRYQAAGRSCAKCCACTSTRSGHQVLIVLLFSIGIFEQDQARAACLASLVWGHCSHCSERCHRAHADDRTTSTALLA